jgi:hypothetical protein
LDKDSPDPKVSKSLQMINTDEAKKPPSAAPSLFQASAEKSKARDVTKDR